MNNFIESGAALTRDDSDLASNVAAIIPSNDVPLEDWELEPQLELIKGQLDYLSFAFPHTDTERVADLWRANSHEALLTDSNAKLKDLQYWLNTFDDPSLEKVEAVTPDLVASGRGGPAIEPEATIKFCTGVKPYWNKVTDKVLSWNQFAESLVATSHGPKGSAGFYVGAIFKGGKRNGDSFIARTLLTLDIDNYQGGIDSLEKVLKLKLKGLSWVGHSTASYNPDNAKVRVVIPLAEPITELLEFKVRAEAFCSDLDIIGIDPASWVAVQLMYYQTSESKQYWSHTEEGATLTLPSIEYKALENRSEVSDLHHLINSNTERDLRAHMVGMDAEERDVWVNVLSHLARSGPVGRRIAHDWASTATGNGSDGKPLYSVESTDAKLDEFAVNGKSHYAAIFNMPSTTDANAKADVEDFDLGNYKVPVKAKTKVLSYPPGFIGDVAKHIYTASRMRVSSFAVAGALSVCSFLSQNKALVKSSQTGLNLYFVLIGDTARGKEDPRKVIKNLIRELSPSDDSYNIAESMSSGVALLRSLKARPNLLLMSDEYGMFMQAAMLGKSDHTRDFVKEVMSFYGLALSSHVGKQYANTKDNIGRIDNPFLNILGTTTGEELFKSINMTAINNGSVNRNIYVFADENNTPNRSIDTSIPKSIIARFARINDFATPTSTTALIYDADAEAMIANFGDNLDKVGEFAKLWSRAEENAIRIAGLLAYYDESNITTAHVEWAIEYVTHHITYFETNAELEVHESDFAKQQARTLDYISNPLKFNTDKKYSPYLKKGLMPRGKLTKLMKVPPYLLDGYILHLITTGEIAEVKDGKTVLYAPN